MGKDTSMGGFPLSLVCGVAAWFHSLVYLSPCWLGGGLCVGLLSLLRLLKTDERAEHTNYHSWFRRRRLVLRGVTASPRPEYIT